MQFDLILWLKCAQKTVQDEQYRKNENKRKTKKNTVLKNYSLTRMPLLLLI